MKIVWIVYAADNDTHKDAVHRLYRLLQCSGQCEVHIDFNDVDNIGISESPIDYVINTLNDSHQVILVNSTVINYFNVDMQLNH